VLLEAARLEHFLDELRQAKGFGGLAQVLDDRDEGRDRSAASPADDPGARHVHEASHAALRGLLELLDRSRADAARREIHDAREGGVVVRVAREAKVGHRVLDLLALEEAQPPVDDS
jgi:hypothetical protein